MDTMDASTIRVETLEELQELVVDLQELRVAITMPLYLAKTDASRQGQISF